MQGNTHFVLVLASYLSEESSYDTELEYRSGL